MPASQTIPRENRAPELKKFLLDQSQAVAQVRERKKELIADSVSPFLYLAYPWLVEPTNDAQRALFTARRNDFGAVGFNGAEVREALEEILRRDKHLRECCVSSIQLAH